MARSVYTSKVLQKNSKSCEWLLFGNTKRKFFLSRGYKNSSRTGEGEPTLEAVQPLSIDWIRHNGHLTNRVRGGESFFPEGSWSTSVEGFDFSFHHRDGTQSIFILTELHRNSHNLSKSLRDMARRGTRGLLAALSSQTTQAGCATRLDPDHTYSQHCRGHVRHRIAIDAPLCTSQHRLEMQEAAPADPVEQRCERARKHAAATASPNGRESRAITGTRPLG